MSQPATASANLRRKQQRRKISSALILLIIVAVAIAIGRGWLHPVYLPLPQLNLAAPNPALLDWQITRLSQRPDQCRTILARPFIAATPISDQPAVDGCGWNNAVKVTAVASARMSIEQLNCGSAAAAALWMHHVVQPVAREKLGQAVAVIHHFGAYSCRNIVANPLWRAARSQHAAANALDISGFTLTNGRFISIAKHWSSPGSDGDFLRTIHAGACRYFRVSLGPSYNAAHRDHFHLDRGPYRACR